MNKSELVGAIAREASISKVDAKKALEAGLKVITEAVASGDKVALVGFGTFAMQEKAARTGINPTTKEKIEIPAKKTVKFKPGVDLTAAVK